MLTTAEYLRATKQRLLDNYNAGEKIKCGVVATETAGFLLKKRKTPYILVFEYNGLMHAKGFLHGCVWTKHYICCCNGQAYDPFLGEVVPVTEYSDKMFGKNIFGQGIRGVVAVPSYLIRGLVRELPKWKACQK